ncbi:MAG TPA: PilZ domain-containing protein [Nitrospirales bacterium]|nr:PilZ domain-containing protein [Nitrospirales bacterium]
MEKMELPSKTVGTIVGERRKTWRYHILTRVDILVAGALDVYWGSTSNISRTGVALCARQSLKPGKKVTIRFRFHDEKRREVTESLAAKVIWRNGDNMGLEFEPPLTTGSPALQQAPFLVAHLMMNEARR